VTKWPVTGGCQHHSPATLPTSFLGDTIECFRKFDISDPYLKYVIDSNRDDGR